VTFEAGSSLSSIGAEAFRGASGLTSIVIPSTVTLIRTRAFQDATGLTSVTFEGNAPSSVGSFAFLDVASGAVAYIGFAATGFEPDPSGQWQGLVLERAADPSVPEADPSVPVEDSSVPGEDPSDPDADPSDPDADPSDLDPDPSDPDADPSDLDADPSVPDEDPSGPAGPALACSLDGGLAVGSLVTCMVVGGDAGVGILWRAAFNPTFAEAGVTLDRDGSGEFSFVVPAEALGELLTVELVEWVAPMVLGTVGGPVPVAVPTGDGPVPVPVWQLPLLFLASGLALRTRRRSRWPGLRVS
jgi:hypothetical protein